MKKQVFTQGQTRIGYRIDGGVESDYTHSLDEANKIFDSVVEDFGQATLWEIAEQYDISNDWEIIEDNIIRQKG